MAFINLEAEGPYPKYCILAKEVPAIQLIYFLEKIFPGADDENSEIINAYHNGEHFIFQPGDAEAEAVIQDWVLVAGLKLYPITSDLWAQMEKLCLEKITDSDSFLSRPAFKQIPGR